jgi:hypothetical protein
VKYDIQQGTVHLHSATVIVDESQFCEFVHEEIHAAPGRTHKLLIQRE